MTSHVEEQIKQQIAKAKAKRAKRRQQRAELDQARQPGLQARHEAKMRRWQQEEDDQA
jgi:hypothetical protein